MEAIDIKYTGELLAGDTVGLISKALVGFQGRGFVDGVQPDFCHSLLLEALIFQQL